MKLLFAIIFLIMSSWLVGCVISVEKPWYKHYDSVRAVHGYCELRHTETGDGINVYRDLKEGEDACKGLR